MNKIKKIYYFIQPSFKYIVLILAAFVMLFPFYWMIIGAFKTSTEIAQYPPTVIPQNPTLDNIGKVFSNSALGTYFLNSCIVAVVETILVAIISVLAAYAFYKYNFKGKKILFISMLIVSMLPLEVVMVFNYKMMISWGLNNTLTALFLPFIGNFFYVYILYNAFRTIPESVYSAAKMDGCSDWKFLWKIALPTIRATLIFVCIMNVVSAWNSFAWPMLITNSVESRTLPFGIYTYIGDVGADNELIMAMTLISQLPVILLFIFLRKYFVNGFKSNNK